MAILHRLKSPLPRKSSIISSKTFVYVGDGGEPVVIPPQPLHESRRHQILCHRW